MSQSEALIIFVKNPIAGKAKTRLGKTIGTDNSLRVYEKLLDYTLSITRQCAMRKYLYYNENLEAFSNWEDSFYIKHQQAEGHLGIKMKSAFSELFAEHSKIVIIGSDCPEIDVKIINSAFNKLDVADIVLGPSSDGGYYLIGMKEDNSELFEDIDWSTAQVLNQTIAKIKAKNLLYTQLPILSDIDTEADLKRFPDFSVS